MKEIHVNLKRFDIPKKYGGLCPVMDSSEWIKNIIEETIHLGLGDIEGLRICYFLPESLIQPASLVLKSSGKNRNLFIGSQSVFRNDVSPGKNFGAFTTNLPAAAASNLGAAWTIIGHSEERKDKEEILQAYDSEILKFGTAAEKAGNVINSLLNQEVLTGMKAGMNILYCVGETELERGSDDFSRQKPRIIKILRSQLIQGLAGLADFPLRELVIGYEPRWAIGPGKTPPDADYIAFVSASIKNICFDLFGREFPVIYGGGLKEGNAAMIAGIPTIDGGLVALTRFTGEIGFFVEDFRIIVDKYLQ
ncbi:MAG: triose-phosphate isomerase [Candidatus Brocadiales bacterium]|nr:triose-phosphate isomerase [Candidatus Brocadiales bacterium]MBL7005534.1 triose-phosphate isomerase [Spirochaetia bacterium]